ncbi:TetR family transcriptional regulator [Nocardioides sp. cx-169]|uniref:TetR/AcrR family transcriptional regulator n=1 Tax=Nocardioides sp. cx-169 TaxID=2899080 RepID=UPI001E28B2CA|nr:TetR family transcriptional regulator [Nocardioides sp. cx-169]MCD4533007.1 TetR family transcriptional regulator [Nocardioides sp. cx-169]
MIPPPATRRRHAAGQATRERLLKAAEQLFAIHGLDGVTLREIRLLAEQSNSSAIAYHFGSKEGLVRALVDHRYRRIDARRLSLFQEAEDRGLDRDPRTIVLVVVRPLLESIEAGEMFVPFLARLSTNAAAREGFWPRELPDSSMEVLTTLVSRAIDQVPDRLRRAREVQLHNSVLNLLSEHALRGRAISPVRLSGYVDGWAALLTAPCSAETMELLRDEAPLTER